MTDMTKDVHEHYNRLAGQRLLRNAGIFKLAYIGGYLYNTAPLCQTPKRRPICTDNFIPLTFPSAVPPERASAAYPAVLLYNDFRRP